MPTKNLPIEYNSGHKIGVVSDDPLTFLLYSKFFDDFHIAASSKQDWLEDLKLNATISNLNIPPKKGEGISRLIKSKKFIEGVKADPKRKYVLYSPLDPPYKVNPLTYLMNSPTIAHAYENKRYFRDEFADLIRMPEYEIKYINELDRAAAYRDLRDEYGDFVLQDEESSGSKGTYIVRDYEDFTDAVKALKKFSQGRSVVVSKFIKGENSSIQVCITKYGIFSGGIQRQLINSKHLCNPKMDGAAGWCGGEIGAEYPDFIQHQAQEMATVVGSELASHGYKGIFGIDLIVTPDNELYAIEINARLTGYTHLVSDMQYSNGKIPFLLLHLLELGNFKYEVTDYEALPAMARYKKPVSYLIINNPLEEEFTLDHEIKPGVYKLKDGKLEFVKAAYSIEELKGEDSMLIFCKYNQGDVIDRGKRILKITKLGKSMSKGDLNTKNQQLVKAVKETFGLPA
jgi:hypothetical protein